MKEQHPTEEQLKERENIKCQYCQKKFKTKDNRNEHELGCVANKDREELKCEMCDLGGGFMSTREYWLTRECAMSGKDKRMKNDKKMTDNWPEGVWKKVRCNRCINGKKREDKCLFRFAL